MILNKHANRVATGDEHNVDYLDRIDEIGMTQRSVNQLGRMFRWLVNDVSHQIHQVAFSCDQLAAGIVISIRGLNKLQVMLRLLRQP